MTSSLVGSEMCIRDSRKAVFAICAIPRIRESAFGPSSRPDCGFRLGVGPNRSGLRRCDRIPV
eukprot:1176224-Prorocentrum_lima.AAC.1